MKTKLLSKYDRVFKVVTDRGARLMKIKESIKKISSDTSIKCANIRAVFLVCGGNDIENVRDLSTVQGDYKSLLKAAQIAFPNASINAVSMLPRRTVFKDHARNMRDMNKWMEYHCKERKYRFVNIFSFFLDRSNRSSPDLNYKLYTNDELHLSAIGDSVLAKVLIAVANKPRIFV